MRKPLLLLSVAMLAATNAFGSPLTPEQALARMKSTGPTQVGALTGHNESELKFDRTIGDLYVFAGQEGFVVLPADDAAPAVLAFSDKGSFDVDNPGLAYWLDFYNSELESLRAMGAPAVENGSVWRVARADIAPLLTTEWNQEAPYNEMCPKVDGHETVTGCVATAMAQVMKYHNYPVHGKGTHSYLWRPGEEELSFDYESTPFQWNLMTDRYNSHSTPEERHAVAQLMYACGVSVDMHYEPGGSGAATTVMGEQLIDIFDYSPSIWMPNRGYYGYTEWEDMIYADLAQGLPVLYSGAGTAGGHQFVCDGYRGDGFFHFNWGWGGMSNGYFLLTALNPADLGVGGGAGGFNSSQVATLGVRPPRDGDKRVFLFYNNREFTTDAKSAKAGDDFVCTGLYFNYSLSTMPEGSRLGLKFMPLQGGKAVYVEGPGIGGFHPDDGRENIMVKFPELADGDYYITPALFADGDWSDVRMPVGYPGRVLATVKNLEAVFESEAPASVTVRDIDVPEIIYRERECPLPFSVENKSELEYYGSLTPVLLNADGTVVALSTFRPVDVLAGETERVSDYIADFKAEKGQEFPAGDYRLVFRDEAGKYVSVPENVRIEIETEKTEISITDFRLADGSAVQKPDEVRFVFTVSCLSGYYFASPRVLVFHADGGDEFYHKSAERIYLVTGQSSEISVVADMDNLDNGRYMAIVYDGDKPMTDRVYFTLQRETTGLDAIAADGSQEFNAYDLSGVRHTPPLAPGLYIINGKRVAVGH